MHLATIDEYFCLSDSKKIEKTIFHMIDQGFKSPKPRQCKILVMDTIADPHISFADNGVSNYYQEYIDAEKTRVLKGDQGRDHFNQIVQKIRKDNNGTYDCVLGVSGGVDSSYLAYLAAQAGLKVLRVQFIRQSQKGSQGKVGKTPVDGANRTSN